MENAVTTIGLSDALTNVSTLFTNAVTMVSQNWIPMTFIGISLAGAGLGLLRRTIHTR